MQTANPEQKRPTGPDPARQAAFQAAVTALFKQYPEFAKDYRISRGLDAALERLERQPFIRWHLKKESGFTEKMLELKKVAGVPASNCTCIEFDPVTFECTAEDCGP
jgi:hypothetical protein